MIAVCDVDTFARFFRSFSKQGEMMKKQGMPFFLSFMLLFAAVLGKPYEVEATPLTMTFDLTSYSCSNSPASYSEHGMRVSASRNVDICENHRGQSQNLRNHRVSGSTPSNPYFFEYMSGSAFDLISFDILTRFRGSIEWNPGKSLFTSSNGGSRTIDTLGLFDFSGPEWTNITWLRWDQEINRPAYAIHHSNTIMDNLVFAPTGSVVPTPEPATFVLLGSGLLVLFGLQYLKRREVRHATLKKRA